MSVMELRTPCCGRKVRSLPIMEHVTQVVHRTYPKCRVRHQVIARPSREMVILGHGNNWATQVEWTA